MGGDCAGAEGAKGRQVARRHAWLLPSALLCLRMWLPWLATANSNPQPADFVPESVARVAPVDAVVSPPCSQILMGYPLVSGSACLAAWAGCACLASLVCRGLGASARQLRHGEAPLPFRSGSDHQLCMFCWDDGVHPSCAFNPCACLLPWQVKGSADAVHLLIQQSCFDLSTSCVIASSLAGQGLHRHRAAAQAAAPQGLHPAAQVRGWPWLLRQLHF